jgi:hypothetical protein
MNHFQDSRTFLSRVFPPRKTSRHLDIGVERCVVCKEKVIIPAVDRLNVPLRTWPSYSNLVEAAEAGCDICALFRQHLTINLLEKDLQMKEGEIRLYGDNREFLLECAVSQEAFVSQAHEIVGKTRKAPSYNSRDLSLQARSWLDTCVKHHESCGIRSATISSRPVSMLPRRLIDLSQGATIVILDVPEWTILGLCTAAELSKYCTLSYQWGTAPHTCVLSDSFSTLLEMPFSPMPQVFKDAITITRALGIRFLWIDALCIVQPAASGDDTDWRIEGPRMGIICENSTLTLAATCANGTDDGILAKLGNSVHAAAPCRIIDMSQPDASVVSSSSPQRNNNRQRYVSLDICEPSFFRCVSTSPLNARGWVMQERALSHRLIHFTQHGMFWECSQEKLHEHFGNVDPNTDSQRVPCHTKETLLSVARAQSSKHLCPVEWFHFITQYSTTGFTEPQDRLIALSSVAKAAQPMLGRGGYYAGLWRNDLNRGLMWHCQFPSTDLRRRETLVAPTWSWASVEGSISFVALSYETYAHELIDVVDVHAIPEQTENPFGNLTTGRLRLRGRPLKICLPTVNSMYHDLHDCLRVFWDEPQDATARYKNFVILPVGACKAMATSSELVLFSALILGLTETPTNERVYLNTDCVFRRIGWVEYVYPFDEVAQPSAGKLVGRIRPSAYTWLNKAKENWWEEFATTITII